MPLLAFSTKTVSCQHAAYRGKFYACIIVKFGIKLGDFTGLRCEFMHQPLDSYHSLKVRRIPREVKMTPGVCEASMQYTIGLWQEVERTAASHAPKVSRKRLQCGSSRDSPI